MVSPIRVVAAALLAGVLAGIFVGAGPLVLLAPLVLAAAISPFVRTRPRAAWTLAAAAAAGVLGVSRGDGVREAAAPVLAQELASVEGVVVRAADFDDSPPGASDPGERSASFHLAAEPGHLRPSIDLPILFEVRLRLREGDAAPPLLPGDRVRVVGAAAPVRRPTNPGEADRRTRLLREGVSGTFDVDAAGAVTDLGSTPAGLLITVLRVAEIARRGLLERLREACGGQGPAASLLGCLLLNDRSGLDQGTIDAFRDSGTAHLLSVSGLHVVLLAAAARRLAHLLLPRRARRRIAMPSLLLLLLVYCGLCRFDTPVVRAAVFLAAALAARTSMRRPSPIDALAAAAALVVVVDPVQVLDPGFQLSFAAVAGLALYTRGLRSALFPAVALYRKFPGAVTPARLRWMERLASALSTSIAASAATAPTVAAVFGRLQPAAPIANLVAVPLAGVLVPFAGALALVGGCAAWLTAPLAAVAVLPLRMAVGAASRIPGATLETGRPPAAAIVVSVLLLCVAAWWIQRRAGRGAACVLVSWLVLAATPLAASRPPGPEFVALDVGHGLSVLARSGSGGDVLFDAGGHVPGIGRRTIVPALRAMGVRRLGCVFLSHEDADHCSALPDLLAAMSVGEVVVPAGFGADPLPEALVALCRSRGVPVTVVARGDAWIRRGVTVRVLSPRLGAAAASDNETSIVAHVTVGDGDARLTALVPGDIEGAALRALASDPTTPAARLLLLPHHGRGDVASHVALARRLGADVLVASTPSAAATAVPGALVTGRDGAVRVRPGEDPATFPWRDP